MNISSKGNRNQLDTKPLHVDDLKRKRDDEKQSIKDGGEKIRDKIRAGGVLDPYEKGQEPRPDVDEDLIGAKIEQLLEFTEEDVTVVWQWCQ